MEKYPKLNNSIVLAKDLKSIYQSQGHGPCIMSFINLLLPFVYITYIFILLNCLYKYILFYFYWFRREKRPIFNIYLCKKYIFYWYHYLTYQGQDLICVLINFIWTVSSNHVLVLSLVKVKHQAWTFFFLTDISM